MSTNTLLFWIALALIALGFGIDSWNDRDMDKERLQEAIGQ